MLRLLASGLLTRSASRRIARVIPNPFVRTLAVAATGYAVSRMLAPKVKTLTAGRGPGRLGRFSLGRA
jgi:hypothetical protein